MSEKIINVNELFCCPNCKSKLIVEKNITCTGCHNTYELEKGIPLLGLFESDENDPITNKVKAFYETTPFPNYNEIDNTAVLENNAKKSVFGKLLNDYIPYNTIFTK